MKKGFTLLEMIIYVAVFSIFIVGFFSFFNYLVKSRVYNQNIIEVNAQGAQIVNFITQAIRNADFAEASTNEVLLVDNAVISVNNNTLYFQEGANSPIALHNEKVFISDISFLNLAQAQAPDIIRIRFALNSVNNGYLNNFYGTAGLRKYE